MGVDAAREQDAELCRQELPTTARNCSGRTGQGRPKARLGTARNEEPEQGEVRPSRPAATTAGKGQGAEKREAKVGQRRYSR